MAINYTRLKSVAERLIRDNGQPISLSAFAYIDHDDGSVDKVETIINGMGVVTAFNERDMKMFHEIKYNDAKLICSLKDRPQRGQEVTANGITWRIVEFKDINTANFPLVYILQIRA